MHVYVYVEQSVARACTISANLFTFVSASHDLLWLWHDVGLLLDYVAAIERAKVDLINQQRARRVHSIMNMRADLGL